METTDHVPEEPELTSETLDDPFWQTVIGAHNAEADACKRALIAQAAKDNEWHRETTERLTAEGMTGVEFNAAFNREMQAYFAEARSRCVCGEHRPGGLR